MSVVGSFGRADFCLTEAIPRLPQHRRGFYESVVVSCAVLLFILLSSGSVSAISVTRAVAQAGWSHHGACESFSTGQFAASAATSCSAFNDFDVVTGRSSADVFLRAGQVPTMHLGAFAAVQRIEPYFFPLAGYWPMHAFTHFIDEIHLLPDNSHHDPLNNGDVAIFRLNLRANGSLTATGGQHMGPGLGAISELYMEITLNGQSVALMLAEARPHRPNIMPFFQVQEEFPGFIGSTLDIEGVVRLIAGANASADCAECPQHTSSFAVADFLNTVTLTIEPVTPGCYAHF